MKVIMKNKRFWDWTEGDDTGPRTLSISGTIAEESWFDDDVTPELFRNELTAGNGDITVWINSPGGDCIAAARIYNMLTEYSGRVTVKVDGLAASAASVIAMAGDKVLVSPVSMIMIHNPATIAMGDHTDMQKAIDMLNEVKESIMNAYAAKTGLSRAKLSRLMDDETWMNANRAVELGFADGIIERAIPESVTENKAVQFSRHSVNTALINKLTAKFGDTKTELQEQGTPAKDIIGRLDLIKKYI